MIKELIGEFFGTFVIVIFGCGVLALNTLCGWPNNSIMIAAIWGIGVAVAIYSFRGICPAHYNPAVSIALAISGHFKKEKLPAFIISQLAGASIGALLLYSLFHTQIEQLESTLELKRGVDSKMCSLIFCEDFFLGDGRVSSKLDVWLAALLEMIGTMILVSTIYLTAIKSKRLTKFWPMLVGLSVSIVILLIGEYTMAGINPARDFGPRMMAFVLGWKSELITNPSHGVITVYILGPIIGGALTGTLWKVLEKFLK